jgi:hypothetical protein
LERKPRFTSDDHIIPNSKFTTGYSFNSSMMQNRDNSGYVKADEVRNFKTRGGVIIAIDDNIHSAAKGAKRYLVLPFGSANTYWAEDQAKGQKGQEMRVNPVPPVVLVPKKTDKVQNDPERRKIKKKDKR